MRGSLLGFVAILAAGAQAAAAARQPLFDEAALLDGAALPLPALPVQVPTRDDVFGLDIEMREFVAPLLELDEPRQRLVELVRAMENRGMFSLDYDEITRTASGTFHDRQGNCLSFTVLFVTLARAAGFEAAYRSVDVPPSWSNDGQVVIANHVNALVTVARGSQLVVDFNILPYEGGEKARTVSDSYVLGLFYANLAAEAMLRDEYAPALVYLREAAGVYDDLAALWVNLGVLYVRHGFYSHAEAAYLRALEIDANEPSALTNLMLVYEALGETELAADYRERVQDYRERNPYYHYVTAARAYEERQLDDALASLRKALRLKSDEHEFHALRAEVLSALGRERQAAHSVERARELAQIEASRVRSRVAFEAAALR